MEKPDPPLVLEIQEAVLVFGGPYGNLQATEAVLLEAHRHGIPPDNTVCTGDLVAYCGNPRETIELVMERGIHVVMGNCDEQLAIGADDCGCGFPEDGQCARLSAAWFAHARRAITTDQRHFLTCLPRRLDLKIGNRHLAVVHGGLETINAFIYSTSPQSEKREQLRLSGCDGMIGGHCGLPFSELIDNRLWHNAGVIGMPANDGTPRVWYSILRSARDGGLRVEHKSLEYDYPAAAEAMRRANLPPEYRESLNTGLWPNCDILPSWETAMRGKPLSARSLIWPEMKEALDPDGVSATTRPLWPQTL